MRLINVKTRLLGDFQIRMRPDHVISSHRWSDKEISLQACQ